MSNEPVKTGIDVIGAVPWGTHFCQFYQTKEDLLDILVPYFKAGLENNEFCMWITAEPLSAMQARKAMSQAMPDFAERLARGQIEILPHTKWYLKGGKFDQQRVLDGWVDKLKAALAAGYAGLRLTGNTFWLEKRDWKSFTDYEAAVNDVIGQYRMVALCTYSLDKCGAVEVMDVIRNHEFALIRKESKWDLIESSAHREVKQALIDSEKKYRQLLESLQEGVWVLDKDIRTTFVNPRMAQMLGYSVEEMLGKHLSSFVDEPYLGMAVERMEQRWQGAKEQMEFEFRRMDGSPLNAIISAAPLVDNAGNFSGVIAGIVDVTERKRMEDRLQTSEEWYRGLYHAVAGGVIVQDKNGNIVEANALAREILGLKLDEITRRTSMDPEWQAIREDGSLFPGEEHPAMVTLRTGEPVRGTVMGVFHPERGEHRWIIINSEPIKDSETGEVQAVASTFVDITESRRIGEELRRAHDLMEAVTEGSGVSIASQDMNHRYTYFNKPYETEIKRLTGKRLRVGDSLIDLFADMPEQQKVAIDEWARTLRGETSTQRIAFGDPRRYRTVYRVFHTPIRNLKGDVVGAGEVVLDVSQQARIEHALREAQSRTELMAETASELLKSDSPQLVVNSLCAKVMAFLDCQAFFNFLADEPAGRLRLNAYAGVSEEQAREIEWLDYGTAICGCAARDACRLVAENILETPDPRTELVKSYGIQAYACHPLMAQDRVLGTLSFGTRTRTRFTDEELSLMKAVADLVAIAIQRKQTEETLRETGGYLDNLLNYANAPIIVWDPELRITKFNRAFQRLTGYGETEVLGKRLEILFPEGTREESLVHIGRAEAGERWEVIEIPIRRKDGTVRTVLWNSASIRSSDRGRILSTIAQGQDITERKQAEDALRETRDYLDNLLNYANAPIIVWDPELRITKFNHAFQRLTGYEESEVIGKRLDMLFPEETRGESLAHIDRAAAGERWEVIEIPIRRKDGTVRIVLWNSANILSSNGEKTVSTIAQGQDITERKQAEDTLRETRDYLDNLLNYANAPIIVWDPELRITKFNRAFQKLTGYSESEVLGQRLDLLFPEASREQSLAHINRALAGERWEVVEIPIQRVDGVVRTVLWNSANIYGADGEERVATIAQGHDITERKLAEQALRESEERHRLVFEAAMDGFWVTDLSGRLLQVNDSYCQMSGYTRQELLNMRVSDIEAVEKPEETAEHIKRVFQQGQDRFETRHRRKDGKLIDIEVSVKYSDVRGGQLFVSAREITERKQAEEAVRTLNEAVRQRAQLLEAANKELESFAYSVSHDLRAPLRSIDGFSLALLEDYAGKLDDEGKDYLQRVRAASQTMGQLIDDMLNLSRVTRAEIHWRGVDLSSLAQRIGQELQGGEPKRRVELTVAPGLSVHGDASLLRAALENLLSNAWKFTGKRDLAKIEFGVVKKDGERVYFVRDNGVGFDMKYAGKLFEPFQRLHSKDEFSGTGVGLATVRRIINRHGGRIWAEGKVGDGATFYFTLSENKGER